MNQCDPDSPACKEKTLEAARTMNSTAVMYGAPSMDWGKQWDPINPINPNTFPQWPAQPAYPLDNKFKITNLTQARETALKAYEWYINFRDNGDNKLPDFTLGEAIISFEIVKDTLPTIDLKKFIGAFFYVTEQLKDKN